MWGYQPTIGQFVCCSMAPAGCKCYPTLSRSAIRDRIKSSQEAGKSGDKPEKPRWLDDFPENLKHGVAGDALPGWEDILKYCRDKNYGFGRWTWHLLPVQLFFFFLGIALLGLGLLFEP